MFVVWANVLNDPVLLIVDNFNTLDVCRSALAAFFVVTLCCVPFLRPHFFLYVVNEADQLPW